MSSVLGHILFACLFLFQDGSRHLMLHQKLGAKCLEAATLQPNRGQFPTYSCGKCPRSCLRTVCQMFARSLVA